MGRNSWCETIAAFMALIVMGSTTACAAPPSVTSWDPAAFRDLSTLEFRTVGPEEGEHWSTVWLVVIDDQVYIRLGSKAADRMRRNTTAPIVAVRIGGRPTSAYVPTKRPRWQDPSARPWVTNTGRISSSGMPRIP